jgi:hypothetical protein
MNVGVNLNYHTKIVYYDNNSDKHKYKDYDELHLSLLRYGFTARVGFGIAGFFAHYYMTPLFSKGKGPQVYPYVVGMTFTI